MTSFFSVAVFVILLAVSAILAALLGRMREGLGMTVLAGGAVLSALVASAIKVANQWERAIDRRLADRRVWPAIDINRSGTRREELLLDPAEVRRVWLLRKVLGDRNPVEAMELLTSRLKKSRSNAEFLMSMHRG